MRTSHYRQLMQLLCLVCLLGPLNACVGELYQSIKADVDFELEPQVRDRLKTNPEVVAIHYTPETSLLVEAKELRYEPLPIEDPLLEIKRLFLLALREKMGITNIHAMPAPRSQSLERQHGLKMREMVQIYSHGLILDFKPLVWVLDVSTDRKWWQWFEWSITTPSSPTLLAYRARARMIDLDQRELLWQANCSIHSERHPMEKWMSNQNQLLKDKREELAIRCAQYFIEKFFDKPPSANASQAHE